VQAKERPIQRLPAGLFSTCQFDRNIEASNTRIHTYTQRTATQTKVNRKERLDPTA